MSDIPNVPVPVLSSVKLTNEDLDSLRTDHPAYADGYNSRVGILVYFYNRFGKQNQSLSGFGARNNRVSTAVIDNLKIHCWNALKTDNAEELCKALITAAGSKAMVPSMMAHLEIGLWNHADQQKIRAQERPPKGLISVAASNSAGVPKQGAVRCLQMLLRVFPDGCSPDEIKRAQKGLERLRKDGLERPRVEEQLRCGPYNSTSLTGEWRSPRTQWAGLALLQKIISANPRRYAQHLEATAGLTPGMVAKDGSRATRLIVDTCRERITAALKPVQEFLHSRQQQRRIAVVDGEEFICIWQSPSGAGSGDGGYLFDTEKIPDMARTRSRVMFCSPTSSGVPSRWCVSKPETDPIQLLRQGDAMSGCEPLSLERISQIWDASSEDVLQHLIKVAKRPFCSVIASSLYNTANGVNIDLVNRSSTWEKFSDDPIDVYIGGAVGTPSLAALSQPISVSGVPSVRLNAVQALPFTSVTEHKELTKIWSMQLQVMTLMISGSPARCKCLTNEDVFFFAHQVRVISFVFARCQLPADYAEESEFSVFGGVDKQTIFMGFAGACF